MSQPQGSLVAPPSESKIVELVNAMHTEILPLLKQIDHNQYVSHWTREKLAAIARTFALLQ